MYDYPVKILAGGLAVCTEAWELGGREFRAPFFRLYFVTGGAARATVGGEDYPLEAGNAYFLPSDRPSRNHFLPESPLRVNWLHGAPMEPGLGMALAEVDAPRRWPLGELGFWRGAQRRLGEPGWMSDAALWLSLNSLAMALVSDLAGGATGKANPARFELRPAVEYMDREYLDNPPLAAVAAKAHLAPNYFHRKFKELFNGLTPHAYMERKRLCLARGLLSGGGKTVQEVAAASGYDNAFYFSRAFKKRFGISPSQARRGGGP